MQRRCFEVFLPSPVLLPLGLPVILPGGVRDILCLIFRSFPSDPFQGASQEAFPKEISKILMAPINHDDIEIKPDGRHRKL